MPKPPRAALPSYLAGLKTSCWIDVKIIDPWTKSRSREPARHHLAQWTVRGVTVHEVFRAITAAVQALQTKAGATVRQPARPEFTDVGVARELERLKKL